MGELTPFLVKTDGEVGLTYENVQEAIIKLNKTKIKENEEDFER